MYYKIFCVVLLFLTNSSASFNKIEYNRLSKPLDIMVHTTNDLSYKILYNHALHNTESHDNYAFSPAALISVLLAIFEGASETNKNEIQQTINLPRNLDIIRIGSRDVHRRLRTYFFDGDNPLKGLSLNRGQVKVLSTYENILKFYGFDLSDDMIGSASNKAVNVTDAPGQTTEIVSTDATSTSVDPTDITTTTTEMPSATEVTMIMKEESTTTSDITSSVAPEGSSDKSTISELETTQTTEPSTTEEVTTTFSTTTTTTTEAIEEPSRPSYPQNTFDPTSRLFPTRRPIRPIISVMKNQTRIKRHFMLDDDIATPNLNTATIFVYTPIEKDVDTFSVENSFINSQNQLRSNSDTLTHVFYLNPSETIQTTYKSYNSILKYEYISVLRSSIVELELDSKDYSLLLIVPDFNVDLNYVIRNLKFAPSIKSLRNSLKSQWVQAIVPDFSLEGRIFLTKQLQRMGIFKIFEPNRADLHAMTEENGIYIKHIEQSINVRIRTRPISQYRRNATPSRQPFQVHANHPFLFFIVDNEIDIVTICGCIMNPLNVRIQ